MLNSILIVLSILAGSLNLYIHNYPILHGCKYEGNASFKILAFGDPQITGAGRNTNFRKRVDIRGNDLFLKHTASTLRKYFKPDAVFVMGDLISSQWISTTEFDNRADRFQDIFPSDIGKVFNLSGNHDIGYHGEMTEERVERYLRRYGPLNYVEELDSGLRLVAINAMAIDSPPKDAYFEQVHDFIDHLEDYDGETILLTHIPLYKPEGICSDGPMFKYYENGDIRDQNHLTEESSIKILNKVFGKKGGIILTGHDHEGCYSSYKFTNESMVAVSGLLGDVPEITVRSLMGEYGGNGGLLSVIKSDGKIDFKFHLCRFQVQHIWWVTEITTYVTILAGTFRGMLWLLSSGRF